YKLATSVRHAREIGKFGTWLKNSTYAEALLGSSAQLTTRENTIAKLAEKIPRTLFSGRSIRSPELDAARRTYTGARVAETVRQSALFEAAYRGVYNDSEIFYPSDYTLSDEIKWFGAGTAVGIGIDYAIGRYAVRKLIQGAWNKRPFSVKGEELAHQVIFRPNDRGAGITYFADQRVKWQEIRASATS